MKDDVFGKVVWLFAFLCTMVGVAVAISAVSGCGGNPFPVCTVPSEERCNGDVPEVCASGHWYPLMPDGCSSINEQCVDEKGDVSCQK